MTLPNTLLLILLILTQQLHWFQSPWPLTITRTLFQVLFATSALDSALFGLTGIWSALYLYRRRGTDPRADGMTLLRPALLFSDEMFVTPAGAV